MVDWKFLVVIAAVVGVGSVAFVMLENYYINDMADTCKSCLNTCRPSTEQDAYAVCKVCFMQPINGEYLEYKQPDCKRSIGDI